MTRYQAQHGPIHTMDEYISMKTHVPLWHTRARLALPHLERTGISLMREYARRKAYPLLPIQFGQKHKGV